MNVELGKEEQIVHGLIAVEVVDNVADAANNIKPLSQPMNILLIVYDTSRLVRRLEKLR